MKIKITTIKNLDNSIKEVNERINASDKRIKASNKRIKVIEKRIKAIKTTNERKYNTPSYKTKRSETKRIFDTKKNLIEYIDVKTKARRKNEYIRLDI